MRNFEHENLIETDDTIYLAAICQTAVHGWHGMDPNDDCIARSIAEMLDIDPLYMYNWYYENTYDVPDVVITAVKGHVDALLTAKFRKWAFELCFPPKWLITEFSNWTNKEPA